MHLYDICLHPSASTRAMLSWCSNSWACLFWVMHQEQNAYREQITSLIPLFTLLNSTKFSVVCFHLFLVGWCLVLELRINKKLDMVKYLVYMRDERKWNRRVMQIKRNRRRGAAAWSWCIHIYFWSLLECFHIHLGWSGSSSLVCEQCHGQQFGTGLWFGILAVYIIMQYWLFAFLLLLTIQRIIIEAFFLK